MKKFIVLTAISALLIVGCKKNEESTSSGNIASQVVSNLAQVTADFTPDSLATVSTASVQQQTDPCLGVSDWAVCQSNLIREYIKIGKSTVQTLSDIVNSAGAALGNVQDGQAGTTENGKISWNKSNSNNWSVLTRGKNNDSVLYVSVVNNVYTLKMDATSAETNSSTFKAEASVNYTDANNWTVDVFFSSDECSSSDPGAPSRVNIKLTRSNGLWTGKAMLYSPRWEKPNTSVTCNTTAGVNELAMYTEFVGNDSSTKAKLYLAPGSASNFAAQVASGNYELIDMCSTFSSGGVCDVTGGPASAALTQSAYGNPFCTTGPGTSPTWNNVCTGNATVNVASFSPASEWIEPATLKVKVVTLPTSL